ncbi:MAG TPA: SUMF1/EgtB/PvdO family nonheme iron enzyme [Verrucomicrobiae bacterium]|jgi:formylglycine-generating enzyme required for sulfatase activity|nr:SUMF1/EgtB/PvdO family nonheme iron enzyme [Verrucomicrobiae bacterium]
MRISAAFILPVSLFACIAISRAQVHPELAAACPVTARWTNHLGMVFVPVAHTQAAFSIFESRVRDFAAFAATGPKLNGTNWNHALYHNVTPVSAGPDFPVVNVSWNDANAFCDWLTETERQMKLISPGAVYRLPTDAEWSWAADIGDRETNGTPEAKNGKLRNVFPWGTQYPPPVGAGNFADQTALSYFTNWPNISGYTDGYVTTAPVGSFRPNDLGLYDLSGNAAEWCEDSYNGISSRRELRGGSWVNTGPKSLWSSTRNPVGPSRFSVMTGFRCVLACDNVTNSNEVESK